MEHISPQTLHDFCRACLEELKQQKYNIYSLEVEMRRWLQDDTLDNSLQSDRYSSNICSLCRDKLEQLLEFRKMCARSRQTMLAILEKAKQKIPEALVDTKEEMDAIENNQDWLEFDFIVPPHKIETTIFEKHDFNIGKVEVIVEPSIKDIIPPDTKEEKEEEPEPEQTQYIKKEVIEEISDIDQDSESEYELDENFENESSDSDGKSETAITTIKTRSVKKENADKVKATKPQKSSYTKKKPQFQCDECGRKCLSQQNLDNHKRIHQGLKPFQCSQCEASYNKSNRLKRHINAKHNLEKLNITCEFEGCGKTYTNDASYKAHFRTKHVAVEKVEQKHMCEDCGKSYTQLGSLKLHQFTHKSKEEYPFHCNECGKAFAKRNEFKAHQLRHMGIKQFECPLCGLKKITQAELQSHMNNHTREKQWPCERCPLVFSNSGNLRRHDRTVHQGLRPYSCQYCEESFGKLEHLKCHEMRHTGEKPHVCAECGKGFIQKVALKTHMKTHNK